MAFTQKLIGLQVQLGVNTQLTQPNVFPSTQSGSIQLPQLRTKVRIRNSGAPSQSEASIEVFGLDQSLMNSLSTLGMQVNLLGKNGIIVTAGDAASGMTTVFAGTVLNAYADYNAAPIVPFRFECQGFAAQAVAPATALSFPGPTQVATIMQQIANSLGCAFENNGVSTVLNNPYFPGSIMAQFAQCRDHADIGAAFVPPYDQSGNPTLSIFPKFKGRSGAAVLVAPPPSGTMIGFPSFTQQGILVRNVFDPRIRFFGQVQVQSSVKPANGTWLVTKLDHALDSLEPDGLWESSLYCYSPNAPSPVIPPS